MTVAAAIRARLLDLAPVTALVSARVYVLRLPQSPALPAVRVQQIDAVDPFHFRGPNGLSRARVQVDSVGDTVAEAEAVDAAVYGDGLGSDATGLAGWFGALGSPAFVIDAILPIDVRQLIDPEELNQVRVSRDFFVWHRPS